LNIREKKRREKIIPDARPRNQYRVLGWGNDRKRKEKKPPRMNSVKDEPQESEKGFEW